MSLVVTFILPIGGFVLEAKPGDSSVASGDSSCDSGFSLVLIIHRSIVLLILASIGHKVKIRERERDDGSLLKTRSCHLGVGKCIVLVT